MHKYPEAESEFLKSLLPPTFCVLKEAKSQLVKGPTETKKKEHLLHTFTARIAKLRLSFKGRYKLTTHVCMNDKLQE